MSIFYVSTFLEHLNQVNRISSFPISQTDSDHFVTIYDGSNVQSNQIEKLSGNKGNIYGISSTGNSLFVKFESNYWHSIYYYKYTGFVATIQYGNP